MSRITNKNVKIGDSYTLPLSDSTVSQYEKRVESILSEVEFEKQSLLQKAKKEAENIKSRASLCVNDAKDKALEIINESKKQAEKILADAKVEQEKIIAGCDVIKEEAYNEGFKKGEMDGFEKVKSDSIETIQSLDIVAKTSNEIKDNIIKSADLDIVELVIAIAKKVTLRTFDEAVLKDITIEAIAKLKTKEKVTIIVNPQLVDKIVKLSDSLKNEISQLEEIKIVEDASLSCDGTIVETPLSRVDSRISIQIDEIATRLINGITDDVLQE